MSAAVKTEMMTPDQAAEYLGMKKQTLATWRSLGRYDLPYVKVGRSIKYRKSDLDEFIESRLKQHTGC